MSEEMDDLGTDPRHIAISALEAAIVKALKQPLPLSVPRRVFVSYRRKMHGRDSWVERLVAELEKRGNTVLFDVHNMPDCPSNEEVAKFVATMASCHVFLAVLDEGYGERVGYRRPTDVASRFAIRTTMFFKNTRQIIQGIVSPYPQPRGRIERLDDGWVWDELHTALRLASRGRALPFGVLRSGDRMPTGFMLATVGSDGNAWDGRTEAGLISGLDGLFKQIAPTPSMSVARRATENLKCSVDALERGNTRKACEFAAKVVQLIDQLPDGYIALARAAFRIPDYELAFESANEALRTLPFHSEMYLIAGESARQLGSPLETVRLVSTIAQIYPRDWRAQASLGNALDDLGQAYAGIARLEIARKLQPRAAYICTDLGVAYKNIGEQAKALWAFERAKEALLDELQGDEDQDSALANVLVNIAETNMQARNISGARSALNELGNWSSSHPAIQFLERRMSDWLKSDQAHPVLPFVRTSSHIPWIDMQPVPRVTKHVAKCNSCGSSIPIIDETHALCVRCGAEHSQSQESCIYCACEESALLMKGTKTDCPYCRSGDMYVKPSTTS